MPQVLPEKSWINYLKIQIFQPAWLKAIAPTNIAAGFKKASIFPLNHNVVLEACVEGDESKYHNRLLMHTIYFNAIYF